MRIAIATSEFVSEDNFHGGLANYTYKLAKWLLSQNHSVKVFLTQDMDEQFNKTIEYEFDAISVCKIHVPDVRWKVKYYFQKFKIGFFYTEKLKHQIYFKQIAYYLNKEISSQNKLNKFDVIHYPHLGGLLNFKPKGISGVIRLSSSTALCQKMGGYGDSDIKIKIQEKYEIKAMKKANAVFGPSKMVIQETEKLVGRKIELIETPFIPPNVNFDPSVYNEFLNNKKYLLFFGSIGLIKGVGTIAEIINDIFENYKDLYFVFIGKKLDNNIGNKTVWEYLINKAGANSNRIIHLDSLKHNKLFPIIIGSEIVVLPSRTDNFPNTCIEAMANKKIVIGTYGNGFDQLIEDGVNGYLINIDDSKELFNKIKISLNLSTEEKNKMENLAYERSKKLNPDIVLNQVLNLYKKVIN